ncbi:helix-turn-helix transcriptional regulator [Reichenbachiella ulvae]|uniref:Tetratricopeptide repeat protein n=1 Tax=Reichenbachiella ulvae TaxID=2980104 RepID=A0ABT3CYZ0_9BACT|nr:LuxR family transcriptional regulator [Reichenbachiella ulvae]MCV9388423.1 tetratricopeptide repeat protein [Reichenbachiella ulvae]
MAQNKAILDSLHLELSTEQNDSLRALYHFEINRQWAEYNFDSAMHHADQGNELAKQLNNPALIARGLNAIGLAFDFQNQFDSAIHYFKKSESYAQENNDITGRARALLNLGSVYLIIGNLDEALDKYEQATLLYKQLEQHVYLAMVLNNQALIYRRTKRYDMAKEVLHQSLEIYEANEMRSKQLNSLINLSGIYQLLEEFDSAILTAKKSLPIAAELNNADLSSQIFVVLGQNFAEKDLLDSSFYYYKKAEAAMTKNSPTALDVYVYFGNATYYLSTKDYPNAKLYLDKLTELRTAIDKNVDLAITYYEISSQYYEATGQWKRAFAEQQQLLKNKEVFLDQKIAERTTEMEQLFRKEQREWEIERLGAENRENKLIIDKQTQQTTGLLVISVLAGIICIFLVVVLRQRHTSHQLQQSLLHEEIDGLRLRIGNIMSNIKLEEVTLDSKKLESELPNTLTEREIQVLQVAITNKTNSEIAEEVHLSVNTVKYHLKNIYNKLGVSTRLEAREVLSNIN